MSDSLAERIAVVETKVSALENMAEKVDQIYNFTVAEKANRRLRNQFFGGIAGVVAFLGTVWEIFVSIPKR